MPFSDMHKQRKGRNIAMGLALFALAVIFFAVSIVKLQGG